MRLLLTLLVSLAASCQPQTGAAPQLLDQSARQDIEAATIVLFGRVESVSDRAPRKGPSGFRPVEVVVAIQHVWKGEVAGKQICVKYYYPFGGYTGPALVWVESGASGVFSLVPEGSCFRVVNDRRAMIRSHELHPDFSAPMYLAIASATLPTKAGCRTSSNQIASEISSVAIPLIGSRATWRLLTEELTTPESSVRSCACVAIAQVWKLDSPCLSQVTERDIDSVQVDLIRTSNREILSREREWFRTDPVEWLKTMIEAWGIDGALLRLSQLTVAGVLKVDSPACALIRKGYRSGRLSDSLGKARNTANEESESAALEDFDRWLALGCPPVSRK